MDMARLIGFYSRMNIGGCIKYGYNLSQIKSRMKG